MSSFYLDIIDKFEKELFPSLDAEKILLDKGIDLLVNVDKIDKLTLSKHLENAIYYLRAVLLLNMYNRSAREALYSCYKLIWEKSYPDVKLVGMAYLSIDNNLLLMFNSFILTHKSNKYDALKIVGKAKFDIDANLVINETDCRLTVPTSVLHFPEDRIYFYQRPNANFLSILADIEKYKMKFENEKGEELDSTFVTIENIDEVDFVYNEKVA